MKNVTVTAAGGITGSYGLYNNSSSSPTLKTSSISGTTNSIYNAGSTAKIGGTELNGTVTGAGFTCVGVYNASFIALGTNCL